MKFVDYLVFLISFCRASAFNIQLPGLFDLRGLITILLVVRLLLTPSAVKFCTLFYRNWAAGLAALYLLFYAAAHLAQGSLAFIKQLTVLIGTMFIMYYYNQHPRLRRGIFVSCIIGIILMSSEVFYGVFSYGQLPSHHFISILLGLSYVEEINHNAFGFYCMIGSVLLAVSLFSSHGKLIGVLNSGVLIFVTGAVFFSTSRSAIMGLFLTFPLILLHYYKTGKLKIRKAFVAISGLTLVLSLCVYLAMSTFGMDFFRYRLINEPLSFLGAGKQIEYTNRFYEFEEKAESMRGRSLYAETIIKRWEENPMLFLIGGKLRGVTLAAHTMFLNILIDTGLFGFLTYLMLILFIIRSFWLLRKKSDVIPFYFFPIMAILFYCQGQNREYMYPITFGLLGGFFGEADFFTGKIDGKETH